MGVGASRLPWRERAWPAGVVVELDGARGAAAGPEPGQQRGGGRSGGIHGLLPACCRVEVDLVQTVSVAGDPRHGCAARARRDAPAAVGLTALSTGASMTSGVENGSRERELGAHPLPGRCTGCPGGWCARPRAPRTPRWTAGLLRRLDPGLAHLEGTGAWLVPARLALALHRRADPRCGPIASAALKAGARGGMARALEQVANPRSQPEPDSPTPRGGTDHA